MRIALIGQAAFAEKVLETLHTRGEEIAHVFAPPDVPGAKPDPLKARALALGLPVSGASSFKGDAAFEHFRSLNADLAILAYATMIVPERVLYAPTFKSICFHPSLLPRHRGASAINWAIIHGDTETGVTVFWPDKGIDTGPIIVQKRVAIAESDSTGSIYFNQLFPLGVDAIMEAVELIKAGHAPAIAQDESLATYEPPCRDEHARVDFGKPAREVYDLVRGCDPQPGACATLGDKRMRLYDAAFERTDSRAQGGTVVSIDASGMRVALGGAMLVVKRVRIEPSPRKVAPHELAELKAGTRLGAG